MHEISTIIIIVVKSLPKVYKKTVSARQLKVELIGEFGSVLQHPRFIHFPSRLHQPEVHQQTAVYKQA